jgi:ankyrin repeat protein/zinc ribbon protein
MKQSLPDLMKYCVQCGKENREQARFCGHCGRPFTVGVRRQIDSPGNTVQQVSPPRTATPLSSLLPGIRQGDQEQSLKRKTPERDVLRKKRAVGVARGAVLILLGFIASLVPFGGQTKTAVDPPLSKNIVKKAPSVAARQQLAARKIPYTKEQFVREAEAGNTAVVELFLSAGMDPDTTQTFVDYSALAVAVQKGQTKTVRVLLTHGADPNAKLVLGGSLLTIAAERGYTDIVQALLEHGAYVNAKGSLGETALRQARRNGHTDTVRVLRQAGAIDEENN